MTTRTAAAVVARVAVVPAAPAASTAAPASAAAPPAETPVGALRARLAGSSAKEHVVLDFLEDELREARAALAAVTAYVANVEAALTDPALSHQKLLSLAIGGGPTDRIANLGSTLANVRRRLAQVAARM